MSALEERQPIITVKEARKLLGSKYSHFPDKVIERLITELSVLSELPLKILM